MKKNSWYSAKRLLIIRSGRIGDILVTTPAIRAIKTKLPQSKLTLLTTEAASPASLVSADIDDVIVHRMPWEYDSLQDSQQEFQLIELLRESNFDGALIFTTFRQCPRTSAPAYLCYLANIPLRAAASAYPTRSLLTTRYNPPKETIHEVVHALNLVEAVGIHTAKEEAKLVVQVPKSAQEDINVLLSSYEIDHQLPLVIVHPGCSNLARAYPWALYAEVINKLGENFRLNIGITGSKEEKELVGKIMGKIRKENRQRVFSFAGNLSFPSLCALIEAADILITNNTGPMHISAAVQTPVVVLSARINLPQQWGPWKVKNCLFYDDLHAISPVSVVNSTIEILAHCKSMK
ncbi:hypothetical protein KSF_075120 [Reticulibacter mediterranei]|uniref:Glycosyltransferase family 9 protein n=1 Tax=Reticulibacter mediterranei TaxID=2778369 RepID=A0A8J3N3U1_9CHLR|nr:glycosyltransferase family 9 protein [Reticulibacter mediterranei]GHO97464.1 hypothetical protein KSF_075120 [Reticulibacter mediterranei]